MDRTEERRSLRLKYSKRAASNQNRKDVLPSPVSVKGKEEASVPTVDLQTSNTLRKSKASIEEARELRFNLKHDSLQRHEETDANQKQLIGSQNHNNTGLTTSQAEKDREIEELRKQIQFTSQELAQVKRLFTEQDCSFDEFYKIVFGEKMKLNKLSKSLEQERSVAVTKTKEISALQKNLSEEVNMVKELEMCLRIQTDKSKKLEEELQFLIEHANKEKEDLKKQFEKFKQATLLFLEDYGKQRRILLKAVEEQTKSSF